MIEACFRGLSPVVRATPAGQRHQQYVATPRLAADVPGRHAPGTGVLPFEPALALLQASPYQGWLSAEYVPQAATADSLGWLDSWRRGG